ncbi:MAG TPA: amidohydrolase family protein [Limnochordales bacterium]
MVIDLHTHAYPEGYLEFLARLGDRAPRRPVRGSDGRWYWQEAGGLSPVPPGFYDLQARLQDMDRWGVDVQCVSLTTPGLYWAPPQEAAALARVVNDGLAEMARACPGRLVPVASLPLQDPPAAVRELERAVEQLGMRAVFWGSHVAGRPPDDPALAPVLEAARSLGVLVMVHPVRTPGEPRLGSYHLDNLVGFPFENALAAARLLFSGTFRRLRGLRWYFTHLGGAVPFLRGRWQRGAVAYDELRGGPAGPPEQWWEDVYLDTVCFDDDILRFGLVWPGPKRLVFGTDYPFAMRDPEGPQRIRRVVAPGADRERILWQNAAGLLGLPAPQSMQTGGQQP